MSRETSRKKPAAKAFDDAAVLVNAHPIFGRLRGRLTWSRYSEGPVPPDGWLLVERQETVHVHPKRLARPEEWAQLMARAMLVHAMGLWRRDRGDWPRWSAACDVVTARFVQGIKFGLPPNGMSLPAGLPLWDEERWYRQFCEEGVPDWAHALSLGGPSEPTMDPPSRWREHHSTWSVPWEDDLAAGIAESVRQAVEVAAGIRSELGAEPDDARRGKLSKKTRWARDWFISSYPLLGSMVAAFEFVEDTEICRRENILVAAVDELSRTVYLNPAAQLSEEELRFVIAHEVLHVALRHDARRRGRDFFLWNVACDFVINDWLIQMRVGEPPSLGLLHDDELRGLSAEEVYDRMVNDLRRYRKLLTLAGRQGDMLRRRIVESAPYFTDLDAFCREQLGKGLLLHQQQGRGLLPAGLLEEINAVLQPPIGWEVRLARWFDHNFPPVETVRRWTQLSRRQSATPDIPRPRVVPDPEKREGRTFGVVLDTSASMDRQTLAKALGAIASFAEAKEVPVVRVVCCDAAPYDLGWMPAGDIAGRVQIRGRGGTVLQPAINLLENASDFPPDGPLLIITDGDCEPLRVHREHAFLLPPGRRLAFPHRGELFEMS